MGPQRQTRRRWRTQTGGTFTAADVDRIRAAVAATADDGKNQIIHCLSQLKRFAPCIHTHTLRAHQFFYNLGRLQELLHDTTHPDVWWKPIEALTAAGRFDMLTEHVDTLQALIALPYDGEVTKKGC